MLLYFDIMQSVNVLVSLRIHSYTLKCNEHHSENKVQDLHLHFALCKSTTTQPLCTFKYIIALAQLIWLHLITVGLIKDN